MRSRRTSDEAGGPGAGIAAPAALATGVVAGSGRTFHAPMTSSAEAFGAAAGCGSTGLGDVGLVVPGGCVLGANGFVDPPSGAAGFGANGFAGCVAGG